MSKRARLHEIIKCCEIRFNRGEVTTWKHGDFVDLNRDIQRDTGVNISASTLKRIVGKTVVDEDYIPQQATLDALKQYGRFEDIVPTLIDPPDVDQSTPVVGERIQRKRAGIVITIVAFVLLIAGFVMWRSFTAKNIPSQIRLKRTEGQLPATAFFSLQLPSTSDSLFINFGDKSPLKYIMPGDTVAAHIYFIPGMFTVTLQSRKETFASSTAYIQSGNWVGLAFHNQQDIPNGFASFTPLSDRYSRYFEVSYTQLSKMGLDTAKLILTRFCRYTPVRDSIDNFYFETAFKNVSPEKNSYCRGTQFQITGSTGVIRFKFVSTGCSLRVLNIVSEQTFNGAAEDLSQFVLDLTKWNTVKLVNRNRQLTLYINHKKIYSGTYKQSLGELRGLFLEFEGAALVANCLLYPTNGKSPYRFTPDSDLYKSM